MLEVDAKKNCILCKRSQACDNDVKVQCGYVLIESTLQYYGLHIVSDKYRDISEQTGTHLIEIAETSCRSEQRVKGIVNIDFEIESTGHNHSA